MVPQRSKAATKKKAKEKPPPPQFDRSGEMPEGDTAPAHPAPVDSSTSPSGLAGVDLLADAPSTRPTSRFEEYKVEDGETQSPREVADEPVKGEIEVVKVKRKKKKDGSKKRSEGVKAD